MKLTRPKSASAIAVAALSAAVYAGAAASSNIPVYPGAKFQPASPHVKMGDFKICGRKVDVVSYNTPADPHAVAKWYQAHVPGNVYLDSSTKDSGDVNIEIAIYNQDASQVVIVHRMTMGNAKLQESAKTLGMDKTDLGIETFTPPLGGDTLALMIKTKNGDAGAKQQLIAKCPDMSN